MSGQSQQRLHHYQPMGTCSKSNLPEARENATDQVATDFSFASDWLKRQGEISRPIPEHDEVK